MLGHTRVSFKTPYFTLKVIEHKMFSIFLKTLETYFQINQKTPIIYLVLIYIVFLGKLADAIINGTSPKLIFHCSCTVTIGDKYLIDTIHAW